MANPETWPFRAARPWPAFLLAIGIGVAWMTFELATTLVSGRALLASLSFERFLHLIPWQLALFAGIGACVAWLVRRWALSWAAAVWWILGLGIFAFLGEALLEGMLRRRGPGSGVLALALLVSALSGSAWLALSIGRRLRGRAGAGFVAASGTAFSVFFLLWAQHTVSAIRYWEPGAEVLVAYLHAWQALVAVGAGAVAWGLGARRPAGRAAGALVAAALLMGAGLVSRAEGADPTRPDVMVLLIDTLRFDHLGANVGVEGLTPELDALARESVVFTRAFSPGNFTKMAVPGIHASLPLRVAQHPLPEQVTTLAEHLKRAGYATYGISANPYVTARFGYDQGFDRFIDPSSVNDFLVEGLLEAIGLAWPGWAYRVGLISSALYYMPVTVVLQRTLAFLDGSPAPTFVYLQTMDPHGPYLPPHAYLPDDYVYDDFESYFTFDHLKGVGALGRPGYQRHLQNLRQLYAGEVRFTDHGIGELIRDLKARGRWDEMLVVVLSDHGEAFGEKDWAGHSGAHLGRTLMQVPFMVKLPRSWSIPGRVETSLVSTYDLLPTTLSLLGLPGPDAMFGQDLGPLIRSGAAPAGRIVVGSAMDRGTDLYALVRWPWKLDAELDSGSGELLGAELYHLERDPGELSDVAGAHPEVVAQLMAEARAWRAREDRLALDGGPTDLDPLVREQLRKLGYVDE